MDTPSTHLARNIRQLRETRGLTQQQLARLSGVPRATWANLESGSANPTLAALLKVAAALQVSIEELISPPRASARFHPAATLPARSRTGVTVRRLLPDPMPGLDLERMDLPAGGGMVGSPHTPGTREYLICESGEVELTVSGETYRLSPGDVVSFRGDQNHSYRNPGSRAAAAFSVVVIAPAAP